MRVLVMFDLPVLTAAQRKQYRDFRKYLVKNGFLMMQESVYCKLSQNQTASKSIVENLRRNKPNEGLVQILTITEKQYAKMELLVGTVKSGVLNTDERLVVL